MKLIDINDIILGNIELPKSTRFKEYPDYTEDINEALYMCDGLYNKEHLSQTMSHTEFYEFNPLMDARLSDWKKSDNANIFKKELFYAMLCETYIPTVPTELVALFVMTRRKSESPNQMISALDKSKFKRYVTQQFHSNKTIMKDILDEIWGYNVNLVTRDRPIVNNGDIVEIYIDNINEILLCNPSIRDILNNVEDVKGLWYSKDKGIVVGDSEIPLRTLIQSFGIVKNDLDLRRVFLSDEV